MARPRERRGRLEAGRIRRQHGLERQVALGRRGAVQPAPPQRWRAPAPARRCRRSRGRVRRSRPRSPARRGRRPPRALPGRPLAHAARRACEPVEEREAIAVPVGHRESIGAARDGHGSGRDAHPRSGNRREWIVAAHALVQSGEPGRQHLVEHGRSGTPGGSARSTLSTARTPCACSSAPGAGPRPVPTWSTAARTYSSTSATSRRRRGGESGVAHVVLLIHQVSGEGTPSTPSGAIITLISIRFTGNLLLCATGSLSYYPNRQRGIPGHERR